MRPGIEEVRTSRVHNGDKLIGSADNENRAHGSKNFVEYPLFLFVGQPPQAGCNRSNRSRDKEYTRKEEHYVISLHHPCQSQDRHKEAAKKLR